MRATKAVAAISAIALPLQFAALPHHTSVAAASWSHLAKTLEEAEALSRVVVVGRVERVATGSDIVVIAKGEPGDEDRVGTEVVTFDVTTSYRGRVPSAIPIFHTALDVDDATPAPQSASATPPPRRDRHAVLRPEREARRVLLDGDPAYRVGEEYVLFLRPGPTIDGVATYALIGPEGRYRIEPPASTRHEPTLRASTDRGVAPSYDGAPAESLISSLGPPQRPTAPTTATPSAAPELPPTSPPTHGPKHRGRTTTAEIVGAGVAGGLLTYLITQHAHPPSPTPQPQPRSDGRRADAYASRPDGLRPGTLDERLPTVIDRSTFGDALELLWAPPDTGDTTSYRVTIARLSTAVTEPVYDAVVADTRLALPRARLADGAYAWTLRGMDASGGVGPAALVRYFRITTTPAAGTLR